MDMLDQLDTDVKVQPVARAIPIFDNPIDSPATLIVDFAAYSAVFPFPEKTESFRIHFEMFIEFNPDVDTPIGIQISPNIQTAKFINYSQSVIEHVNSFADRLLEFYIVHYFDNNPESVIFELIVQAIKSCNNPIYSIFYHERHFLVRIGDNEYLIRSKV